MPSCKSCFMDEVATAQAAVQQLAQALVRAHPHYLHPKGMESAMDLLTDYLQQEVGYTLHRLTYNNSALTGSENYVPINCFGADFVDDLTRTKRSLIAIANSVHSQQRSSHTLVLNGHYDVDGVYDPSLWSQAQGWASGCVVKGHLYGRGATDMLGGLSALVVAFKLLSTIQHKRNRIILSIVCDEELGGNGSLYHCQWLQKHKNLEAKNTTVLIAEPSDGRLCTASLGFYPFTISWAETTRHAGVSKVENAVVNDIATMITALEDILVAALHRCGCALGADTYRCSIGKLNGGKDASIPLGQCSVEGVIFLAAYYPVPDIQQHFAACVQERMHSTIALTWHPVHFPGHQSKLTPFAQYLRTTSPAPLPLGVFSSPCDARIFANAGFPVYIYGPGDLAQAHATNESLSLDALQQYFQHLCSALYDYAVLPAIQPTGKGQSYA